MRVLVTEVPDDVYELFRERASAEGVDTSTLLRRLIYEYLKQHGNHLNQYGADVETLSEEGISDVGIRKLQEKAYTLIERLKKLQNELT